MDKEPFYNLYNIIENHASGKFNSSFFNELGSSNPSNLKKSEPLNDYAVYKNQQKQYVVFHDQEPIMFSSYKKEWEKIKRSFNLFRTDNILSNSEVNSIEKAELLNYLGWKDFYWFSNGFLALEWYRFYRYATFLERHKTPNFTFSCYNRLIDGRLHRPIISGALLECDLNKIILSCDVIDPQTQKTIKEITTSEYDLFKKYLNNVSNYSENIRINTVSYENSNRSFDIEIDDFQNSFCHIITERIFFENRIHITEKTFRPIVCCRPFIMTSSPYSLQYLKNYGFKTFDKFWDESYDTELDHFKRLNKILDLIKEILKLNLNELEKILIDMNEILIYNRRHFYSKFQEIITQELLDNLFNVLNIEHPKDGNLFQIINNLTLEQRVLLENTVHQAPFSAPLPFSQLDYLSMDTEGKNKIFETHLPFFKSMLNLILLVDKK